jgi:hypothetical protein
VIHSKKIFSVNQLVFLSAYLIVFILVVICVVVAPVYAQFDFNAFLGNQIVDESIDGVIGAEWDDAANYADIAIEPQGTAEVWTKNDGIHLYVAL